MQGLVAFVKIAVMTVLFTWPRSHVGRSPPERDDPTPVRIAPSSRLAIRSASPASTSSDCGISSSRKLLPEGDNLLFSLAPFSRDARPRPRRLIPLGMTSHERALYVGRPSPIFRGARSALRQHPISLAVAPLNTLLSVRPQGRGSCRGHRRHFERQKSASWARSRRADVSS